MRLYRTLAVLTLLASAGVTGCSSAAKAPADASYASGADAAAPAYAPQPSYAQQTAVAEEDATTIAAASPEGPGTEEYTDYGVNPVIDPKSDAFSTFAIDVDTASYTIARSKLTSGSLPPFQAVRAEEFLNYFDYGYDGPTNDSPFTAHLDAAPSPYQAGHHILRVGLKAREQSRDERKPVHLVYLVDTSGSMQSADKLGLVKKSLRILTGELAAGDTVSLCTYAGSTRVVLEPTGGNDKATILRAIDSLASGGGTAMASGMELAFQMAEKTRIKGHVNRVIVLSDGDANIGRSSSQAILQRIGHFKDHGITLSTVGFGRGNYKDTMMEQLANKGDGNYYYIDTAREAHKVFGEQLDGMLEVVARDVKIQVQFDPRAIQSYRLIGYENRAVADRDFRNDAVDAGEIGTGHSVTAIYDVVFKQQVASMRAQQRSPVIVRLRHKKPAEGDTASETVLKMSPESIASSFDSAPANLRFATAVAGFAEILRKSPHARSWNLATAERIARNAMWGQAEQKELVELIAHARRISPPRAAGKTVLAK
jgi:Ca-activated chloride channel family protein